MARIKKVVIALCTIAITSFTLSATTATASEQTRSSHAIKKASTRHASTEKHGVKKNTKAKDKSHPKKSKSEKKTIVGIKTEKKSTAKTKKNAKKTAGSIKKPSSKQHAISRTYRTEKSVVKYSPAVSCPKTRNGKRSARCLTSLKSSSQSIADLHRARIKKARITAMNKLMQQIGKPYRWGGTSPKTGFDCSGLVWYAYKDLLTLRIPRTANEMYHLRDAAPVNRGELESGDLVFFRTQGRGTADHVGVYVGNGKFIQSPRSGREIQITSLSDDYWNSHYVGARRVVTPKTVR